MKISNPISKSILIFGLLSFFNLDSTAQLGWEKVAPLLTENAITDALFINSDQGVIGTVSETFVTTDGGDSWTDVGLGGSYGFKSFDQTIAARQGNENLIVSTDGGTNWQVSFDGSAAGITLSTIEVVNANEFYFLGTDNNDVRRLYGSTDGGQSWDTLSVVQFSSAQNFAIVDGENFYMSLSNGVYKTENGGSSFALKYNTSGENASIKRLQAINDSTVFGMDNKNVFFRSADSGETWETIQTNDFFAPTFQWDMHFFDDMVGHISTAEGRVFRTIDGGFTWSIDMNEQNIFDSSFLYTIFTISPEEVFCGAQDGLILKAGAEWETVEANTVPLDYAREIQLVDDHTIFLRGQSVFYSYDLDTGEYQELTPFWEGNSSDNRFRFLTDNVGVALNSEGTLLKTIDGAVSWFPLEVEESSTGQFSEFEFLNEDEGFLNENGAVLWRTTDNGNSWEDIFQGDIQVFDALSTDLIFLVNRSEDNQMKLWRTTDGGENWEELSDSFGFFYNELHFLNETTGFEVSNLGVRRTSDAGQTWEQVTNLSDITFLDESTGFAKSFSDVLYTQDGGITWSNASPGPSGDQTDFSVFENRIVALQENYYIYQATTNTLSIQDSNERAGQLKLFPNPATDQVTVVMPEGEWERYELIDISGRQVIAGAIQRQPILTIDLSTFSKGIYLVRLLGAGDSAIGKVIKE